MIVCDTYSGQHRSSWQLGVTCPQYKPCNMRSGKKTILRGTQCQLKAENKTNRNVN